MPDVDAVAASEAVSAALNAAVTGPAEFTVDGVTTKEHSLPDLIAADQYLAAKRAAANRGTGLRFHRLIPDGTVGGRRFHGDGGRWRDA